MNPCRIFALCLIFLSTPLSLWFVYNDGEPPLEFGVANLYSLSIGSLLLFIFPLLSPFSTPFFSRLHSSTKNWIFLSLLSCFIFYIPITLLNYLYISADNMIESTSTSVSNGCGYDNLMVDGNLGSWWTWPFFVFGIVDTRWNIFQKGSSQY